jgi:hypothetical protein
VPVVSISRLKETPPVETDLLVWHSERRRDGETKRRSGSLIGGRPQSQGSGGATFGKIGRRWLIRTGLAAEWLKLCQMPCQSDPPSLARSSLFVRAPAGEGNREQKTGNREQSSGGGEIPRGVRERRGFRRMRPRCARFQNLDTPRLGKLLRDDRRRTTGVAAERASGALPFLAIIAETERRGDGETRWAGIAAVARDLPLGRRKWGRRSLAKPQRRRGMRGKNVG